MTVTRRTATLLATAQRLETQAADEVLDVFELLYATKIEAKAERASVKERLAALSRFSRAATRLASGTRVLLGLGFAGVDEGLGDLAECEVEVLGGWSWPPGPATSTEITGPDQRERPPRQSGGPTKRMLPDAALAALSPWSVRRRIAWRSGVEARQSNSQQRPLVFTSHTFKPAKQGVGHLAELE